MRVILATVLLSLLAACSTVKTTPSGYYRVQSGDTLSQIANQRNVSVADLVRWNQLSNANALEVGQLLRVTPPAGQTGSAAPPEARGKAPARSAGSTRPAPTASAPRRTAPTGAIALIWPAAGKVSKDDNRAKSNGLLITNAIGTPVVAAAAGTVAYSGSGLRGYGHLVIIKHDAQFLSIYAHNRKLLVKEGQRVTQGQKIAEMGNSDSKVVGLYFELRYGGQAVDPSNNLPRR